MMATSDPPVVAPTPHQDLVRRLTEWLAMGGFFNPGPMARANENATRELILDVRDALSRVAAPTPETPSLIGCPDDLPWELCSACLKKLAVHEGENRMIHQTSETMSDDEFARIARHGLEVFTESLLQEIAANPRRFASSHDTVKKLAEELLIMRDQRTLAEKREAAPTSDTPAPIELVRKLPRYSWRSLPPGGIRESTPNGEWVLYCDHAACVAQLEDRNQALERRVAALTPVAVAGRLDCTLDAFERRCLNEIDHMQTLISPDNALIALLCDAVRMKREYVARLAAPTPEKPELKEKS